jgi:hypothetical protein|tara:strand:+ start:336 stop:1226 length:891 start_codon:yes stop_codon:yes gene_type:complete
MNEDNGSDQKALDYSLKYNPPMDPILGERNLKEAQQILGNLNVKFLLGSGSCLGAIREKNFITWDDDVDLFSVIGEGDTTEDTAGMVAEAFRQNGYFVGEDEGSHSRILMTIKNFIRLSVEFARITDNIIHVYPGIKFPAIMFTEPKEISFLGEKFLVPNPPEEYLQIKYGSEWMVPKKAGEYEKDVVENIPSVDLVGGSCKLRVLDHEEKPVSGAEVTLVTGGRSKTNDLGYAEIILPGPDWYALVIKYTGHEQVLYMEQLEQDKVYVYRSNAALEEHSSGQGEIGTLGNLLVLE